MSPFTHHRREKFKGSFLERPSVARVIVGNVADHNYWQSTGADFLTLGAPRLFLLNLEANF
jgi:hypothetical protein